ncbi:hypothetical protein Unana1_02264 [Umbelopsis nana]
MPAETAAWDDLLQWQKEIDEKDQHLLRTRAMREAPAVPALEHRQIDLATAEPVGLSALKGKIKAQAPIQSSRSTNENIAAANSEKELGNKAFQEHRYDQAIAHYTKAIEYDKQNAVYYTNRAMAYLKVERFVEAERDSSSALLLQPKHVKALFRRGMARRQLGKLAEAKADLEESLSLASDNGTIKAELDAVTLALKSKTEHPSSPQSTFNSTEQTSRRLDVQFEDTAYSGMNTSADAARSAGSDGTSSGTSVEQKVTPSTPLSPQQSIHRRFTLPKEPKTMTEFTRDWRMCRNRGNSVLYEYMKSINPNRYDDLFKAFLESEHLDQMIEILDQCYESGQAIKDVLEGLLRVKRIDMLIMFLERKQREVTHM